MEPIEPHFARHPTTGPFRTDSNSQDVAWHVDGMRLVDLHTPDKTIRLVGAIGAHSHRRLMSLIACTGRASPCCTAE
jgi:hypothetical protein